MRKLLLICDCGERMQVPRTALGRVGLCPACGERIHIRPSNTTAAPVGTKQSAPPPPRGRVTPRPGEPSMEAAKRKFGRAVDLYFAQRYAEALAYFDELAQEFPDNEEVAQARRQCVQALRHARPPMLEYQEEETGAAVSPVELASVKRFLLDKMRNGSTEAIQLKAAELACHLLALSGNGQHHDEEDRATPDVAAVAEALERHLSEIA